MKNVTYNIDLGHANTKAFITQCGIQSVEESLYAKVPMVAMPFFGDQEYNAKNIASRGFGTYVDRENLTEEGFKEAILEVVNNPK